MDIKILTLGDYSKNDFLYLLRQELICTFGDNIPENYGNQKSWSLLNLIDNEEIDTYQLLYTDDVFWTASGGIIRIFNDEKIYQAGFRAFGNQKSNSNWKKLGLGSKSYSHEYMTTFQIERAKILKCSKVVLSFNENNFKLYKLTKDYHLPKIFDKNMWQFYDHPVMFNGVPQWLLIMYL